MEQQKKRTAEDPPPKETGKAIVSILVPSAWFAFGAYGFVKAVRAKSWPTTTGTIVSAAEATKSAGKGFSHGVEYEYVYTVDRREYRSKQYAAIDSTFGSPEYRKAAGRYQVNAGLNVYYDPEDPKDSAVEPGPAFFHFMMMGVPLAILAVIAMVTIKDRNRKNHSRAGIRGATTGNEGKPPSAGRPSVHGFPGDGTRKNVRALRIFRSQGGSL